MTSGQENVISVASLCDSIMQYDQKAGVGSMIDEFFSQKENRLSAIDRFEFRTESDEFDLIRQEYTLRTSFNSTKENKMQKRIWENELNAISADINQELIEKRYDQYRQIVQWYFLEKDHRLIFDLTTNLNTQIKISESYLENGQKSNPDDLIELMRDKASLLKKQQRMNIEKEKLPQYLFRFEGKNDLTLADDKWLSPEVMDLKIASIINQPSMTTFVVNRAEGRKRLSEEQLDLELAAGRQLFDFAQIRYAGRDNMMPARDFSLGVGINIPTKHLNRSNIVEARLDVLKETLELDLEQVKASKIKRELIDEYEMEKQMWTTQKNDTELRELEMVIQQLIKNGIDATLPALELEADLLENKMEANDLLKRMYLVYLEILLHTGQMTPTLNPSLLLN